jgi:hypothetical protein
MNKTERQMLQEHINMMVENIVDEEFLAEKGKKKKNKKSPKNDPAKKNETDKEKRERQKKSKNSKNAARRARVIKWLKDPSVNCAEIMRKLWKPTKKKEDAARSFFYKCRDGALNDSGIAYSFSEGDINRLYAIKNNLI